MRDGEREIKIGAGKLAVVISIMMVTWADCVCRFHCELIRYGQYVFVISQAMTKSPFITLTRTSSWAGSTSVSTGPGA